MTKEMSYVLIGAAFYTDIRLSESTVIAALLYSMPGPTLCFLCFKGLFCVSPWNSDVFGQCLPHSEYSVSVFPEINL